MPMLVVAYEEGTNGPSPVSTAEIADLCAAAFSRGQAGEQQALKCPGVLMPCLLRALQRPCRANR